MLKLRVLCQSQNVMLFQNVMPSGRHVTDTCTHTYQVRIQRGDLEVKIIKNVKKILEVNGEKRLALICSQEIRISHFNLKGDLVGKIYVWGDMFRIIHVGGVQLVGIFGTNMFRILCSALYVLHYIRYIYLKGDFFGHRFFIFFI